MSDTHVTPILTDLYQVSMAYAYWKEGSHNDIATFEAFFRKCPFNGQYAIVGGIKEFLEFFNNYYFSLQDITGLKRICPDYEKEFFDYLSSLDISQIQVNVIPDGSVVFSNQPIVQLTGPKIICQLLETTLLNLIGHPTLVATYARRIRQQVGKERVLAEFGLRRAQGVSAGINASQYSYIGGFDSTSNVYAGIKYNIPVSGTHAHSYIMSFTDLSQVKEDLKIKYKNSNQIIENFKQYVFIVNNINDESEITTNKSELAAFITYAFTQPNNFLALIDTFDTLESGLINYCYVANALIELGYSPKGIRIDSGDLAYLSKEIKKKFIEMSSTYPQYNDMKIVASNDLDEHIINSLISQGAEIDVFGIGTKLSTCFQTPALGMVFKLVEINNIPRIKISENDEKTTIPYKKYLFRLYNSSDKAVLDLITNQPNINDYIDEDGNILCVEPKIQNKRVKVKYFRHEELLVDARTIADNSINISKQRCDYQISTMRGDYLRISNPTPYIVTTPEPFAELIRQIKNKEKVVKTLI